jgi:hypothetical protein
MSNFTAAGQQLVNTISARYGISADAAQHMILAVYRGQGSMAQFNSPELGGSGQWMRGGMTMVGDMFNYQLKSRVDSICNDIAMELAKDPTMTYGGSFQSQSQNDHTQAQHVGGYASSTGNGMFVNDASRNWWPSELGQPSATGAQNNMRYAYFPQTQRLAVSTGSSVWVYNTLNHQIGGFSQQQGSSGGITLSSQFGTVNLSTLPVVSRDGVPAQAMPAASTFNPAPPSHPQHSNGNAGSNVPGPGASHNEILETLERIGSLRDKGYLSEEEFNRKKSDLLQRL